MVVDDRVGGLLLSRSSFRQNSMNRAASRAPAIKANRSKPCAETAEIMFTDNLAGCAPFSICSTARNRDTSQRHSCVCF
ncbi:hypothetical protein [Nocardia arizonensis]|uniref:hypothetical protein n=1 Tax=Nocardia arizonensis TaxID=1141647 RepID=UPI0012E16CB5|nr:hypothetical protein [Nocardia arizonensis]